MQRCPSRPGGGGGREPNAARTLRSRGQFVHVSGLYCGQCLCLSDGNLRINVAAVLIAGVERAARLFLLGNVSEWEVCVCAPPGDTEEGGGGWWW